MQPSKWLLVLGLGACVLANANEHSTWSKSHTSSRTDIREQAEDSHSIVSRTIGDHVHADFSPLDAVSNTSDQSYDDNDDDDDNEDDDADDDEDEDESNIHKREVSTLSTTACPYCATATAPVDHCAFFGAHRDAHLEARHHKSTQIPAPTFYDFAFVLPAGVSSGQTYHSQTRVNGTRFAYDLTVTNTKPTGFVATLSDQHHHTGKISARVKPRHDPPLVVLTTDISGTTIGPSTRTWKPATQTLPAHTHAPTHDHDSWYDSHIDDFVLESVITAGMKKNQHFKTMYVNGLEAPVKVSGKLTATNPTGWVATYKSASNTAVMHAHLLEPKHVPSDIVVESLELRGTMTGHGTNGHPPPTAAVLNRFKGDTPKPIPSYSLPLMTKGQKITTSITAAQHTLKISVSCTETSPLGWTMSYALDHDTWDLNAHVDDHATPPVMIQTYKNKHRFHHGHEVTETYPVSLVSTIMPDPAIQPRALQRVHVNLPSEPTSGQQFTSDVTLHEDHTAQVKGKITATEPLGFVATMAGDERHGNTVYHGWVDQRKSPPVIIETISWHHHTTTLAEVFTEKAPFGLVIPVWSSSSTHAKRGAEAVTITVLDDPTGLVTLDAPASMNANAVTSRMTLIDFGGSTHTLTATTDAQGRTFTVLLRPSDTTTITKHGTRTATVYPTNNAASPPSGHSKVTVTITRTVDVISDIPQAAHPKHQGLTLTRFNKTFTVTQPVANLGSTLIPITSMSQLVGSNRDTLIFQPEATFLPVNCEPGILKDQLARMAPTEVKDMGIADLMAAHPDANWTSIDSIAHDLHALDKNMAPELAKRLAIMCMQSAAGFSGSGCNCGTAQHQMLVPATAPVSQARAATAFLADFGDTTVPVTPPTTITHNGTAFPFETAAQVPRQSTITLANLPAAVVPLYNATQTRPHETEVLIADATPTPQDQIPFSKPDCKARGDKKVCKMDECMWQHNKPIGFNTVLPGIMIRDPNQGDVKYGYITKTTSITDHPHWGQTKDGATYFPQVISSTINEHGIPKTWVIPQVPPDTPFALDKLTNECWNQETCWNLCYAKVYSPGHGLPRWALITVAAVGGLVLLCVLLCCCACGFRRHRRRTQSKEPLPRKSSTMRTVDPVTGRPVDPATGVVLVTETSGSGANAAAGAKPAARSAGTFGRRAEEGRGRGMFSGNQGNAGTAGGGSGASEHSVSGGGAGAGAGAGAGGTTSTTHDAEKVGAAHGVEHVENVPVHDGADGLRTGSEVADTGSMRGRKPVRADGEVQ